MIVTIKFELKNSMVHESPETIKKIAEEKVKELIRNDAFMNIFVCGYGVVVEK